MILGRSYWVAFEPHLWMSELDSSRLCWQVGQKCSRWLTCVMSACVCASRHKKVHCVCCIEHNSMCLAGYALVSPPWSRKHQHVLLPSVVAYVIPFLCVKMLIYEWEIDQNICTELSETMVLFSVADTDLCYVRSQVPGITCGRRSVSERHINPVMSLLISSY